MKKYLIVFVLLSYNFCLGDTLSLNENKIIVNHFKNSYSPEKYVLLNDNYFFNGYFVIKFKSDSLNYDKDFYFMDLYWISNLDSFYTSDKIYYEFIGEVYLNSFKYLDQKRKPKTEVDYFMHYYLTFNKISKFKSYLFGDQNNNINLNLFRNVNYVFSDNQFDYLIFKVSFYTAVLYDPTSIKESKLNKLFFPISDLISFETISEEEIQNLNLIKKQIYVNFYK